MPRLLASVALLALARAQGGLIDHPIAGDSLVYLDSQEWTASTPGLASIRATVPGDLITDLQVAGLIGDPLYELIWLNSSIWDARVWTFTRSFSLAPAALAALAAGVGDMLLVFDGVKMSATISLNGAVIGHTTNQFLRYTFSLAAAAAAGARLGADNTLAVAFDAADQTTEGRWMACTGGWDWCVAATAAAAAACRRERSMKRAARSPPLKPSAPARASTTIRTPAGPPTPTRSPWARAPAGQRPRAPSPRGCGRASTS